ncbi:hypothetical protein [Sulfobacillus thermosulfidooxidans]|uniref:hypothetical protein n=1 Tax=Sulfobacillus thermosulfidooxidans TaxID=28034 RepID=UPI0006B6947A|nr:hypothetical protein [Sulfobacillus thermosulfidooxidans]
MSYADDLMRQLVKPTPVITPADQVCADHRAWERDQWFRKKYPKYRQSVPEWPEPDLSDLDPDETTGYWRAFLLLRQQQPRQ